MASHVVIAGSGVAGAVVAKELLVRSASVQVTVLEAGRTAKARDGRIWLDFVTADKNPWKRYQDALADSDSSAQALGVQGSRVVAVGGSTLHWGGWSLRFKPEDFRLRSGAGVGADWAISYDDLAPYYVEAEHILGVCGDSSVDSPPRYGAEYPSKAIPYTIVDGEVIHALEALAITYENLPIARFAGRCLTTGTCRYCPVGGRYDALLTLADLARFEPRFRLIPDAPVERVVMSSDRKAEGVEYRDAVSGDRRLLAADCVVLCAGTIESTKILMLTKAGSRQASLGNHSGHLGRHLLTHPPVSAEGVLPSNPKLLQRELDFPTLASRHFDTPVEQPTGKFFFVASRNRPKLDLAREMRGGKSVEQIVARTKGEARIDLRGFVEQLEDERQPNRIEPASGLSSLGIPRTRIDYRLSAKTQEAQQRWGSMLESVLAKMGCKNVASEPFEPRADHAVGTCRMSKEAKDGVVDENLRVHETDNVFVCSNAVMPNVTAVNPTLSLVALAVRLGRSLTV